ncbi:putative phosphoribosylaminoimidazole-succinocarboxamide synthase [Triangularia verruculosa]|uniref:Phosphoribosylaminoimidazole-succinocarboxamide synthase n=1 Tax=Triangularia verruculosa TaxID=2587418 RepID=A0AAN6XFK1_9PEZI|nr:putative phosphoribosylaminoimidazole-succinocarboxamide synthase [Triangularia verruculosa]
MSFQNNNTTRPGQPRSHMQYNLAQQPRSHSNSSSEVTPPQRDEGHAASASHPSSLPPPAPPQFSHAPSHPTSPPVRPTSYGADQIHNPPAAARAYGQPVVVEGPYQRGTNNMASPPGYQQPGSDWEPAFNARMLTDFREDLARLDGVITPGVDDTPYIHHAIEALTRRDRDTGYSANESSSGDSAQACPSIHPNQPNRQIYQHPQQTTRPISTGPIQEGDEVLQPPNPQFSKPNPAASADSLADSLLKGARKPAQPHEWRPVEREEILNKTGEWKASGVPPLTFRPWPLRPPALFGFMAMCVLMIAALAFSAVWSHLKQGLVGWDDIVGGRYFVFRILPQLIGAIFLLYAQFIITTIFRVLPFVRLASDNPDTRDGAVFQQLYPSFLWPQFIGPWNVWVPIFVTWLTNFTVPLQSSLFTAILVDRGEEREWVWATCQGVAWTLVGLYLLLLISTVIVWRFWATTEKTGLIWDPRSLADYIAIVSETNTATDYRGTQLARGIEGIRFALRRRAHDRLGYWTWKDGRPGYWHTLGSPMDNESNLLPFPDVASGQRMEKQPFTNQSPLIENPEHHADLEASDPTTAIRHRYLPWILRTSQLLWFIVASAILLAALFVVSFLPATRISQGFTPGLRADPQPGAFSPANFLYAFLPSSLGMLLFLGFQHITTHFLILTPWAALSSPGGCRAEEGLLADYPACLPLQSSFKALRNKHFRAAFVSLCSVLFLAIPILAGGMFMALTKLFRSRADDEDGVVTETWEQEVRMYANMPAYILLLAVLSLYLVALVSLVPKRRKEMGMPHGVGCLAEMIGYLVNNELREELPFKRCVNKEELLERMGAGSRGNGGIDMSPRWYFGFGGEGAAGVPLMGGGEQQQNGNGNGGGMETELGVRRMRRFTEKRKVRKSMIRRGNDGLSM